MAKITMTVEGPNVGTFIKTMEVSDQDAGRILAAYGNIYGPITVPAAEEGGEPTTRPRTAQEIVDALALGTLNGILANVQREESEKAARDAAAGVQPIVATPA